MKLNLPVRLSLTYAPWVEGGMRGVPIYDSLTPALSRKERG